MISTRFRAALLMFHTWLGYLPPDRSRSGRAALCVMPSTFSELLTSGNCVGMPELRWCVCQLVAGSHCAGAVTPGATVCASQLPTASKLFGLDALPVCVS